MLSRENLEAAGLAEFEVSHAIGSEGTDYGNEHVVQLEGGRQLRCPAFPEECDYVRLTTTIDGASVEIAYWNQDEFKESPAEVLGALMGAAGGARTDAIPAASPTEPMSDVYVTSIEVTVMHKAHDDAELRRHSSMTVQHLLDEAAGGAMLVKASRLSTRRVPQATLPYEQIALGYDGKTFGTDDETEEEA